jgi:CRP-like cAMP-binding protein
MRFSGDTMRSSPYKNHVLAALPPEALERLALQLVDLPAGMLLQSPGRRIRNLFFLEDGVAAITVAFRDGAQTGVALVGCEGLLGGDALSGARRGPHPVSMLIAGYGFRTPLPSAMLEFRRGTHLHDLALRALHSQFLQAAQTAGCNAHHSVEQRLARWLLLCSDRYRNRTLSLSHEYIGDLLGVTRSSVTLVAHSFQQRQLIQYSHGKINLLDLPGLARFTCECYRSLDATACFAGRASMALPPMEVAPRKADKVAADKADKVEADVDLPGGLS